MGSFSELRKRALPESLWSQLDWRQQNALRTHAPSTVTVPSGRDIALSYEASGPPVLAVKVQELFGSRFGPRIADGRIPVLLHLLNPAGRPLQVTRDLESFWTRTWPEVRKEMRTRYPKHRWPIDPITATPSRHSVKRRKT